jgi:hypothetical protein
MINISKQSNYNTLTTKLPSADYTALAPNIRRITSTQWKYTEASLTGIGTFLHGTWTELSTEYMGTNRRLTIWMLT